MSFEKLIRIPADRVGALIGRSGKVKAEIERICFVKLQIDSETGEIEVTSNGAIDQIQPFKAVEIVTAIGRGFSPHNAMKLLKEEYLLHVMDLRDFVGKSPQQIERIKGRIIGEGGRARVNMENLTNTNICVYGKTVSIIGEPHQIKVAISAITSISTGSKHGSVYGKLEANRRREKLDRLQLWETDV
ncbi:MAG: KH domain-containing protein [Candidatus Nitrosotenuis sp.]|uniref:Putative KH type 1 domain protein n=1 Tax=Candidatus Nitrosotenuis uzonensis TaxID=1407055 RepID=A0A812F4V7_9ARCH|nr:KH domain-containing protein [Candidatus Nitrosotenuis uzonensis]CAE6495505.1 putative KH type 1 domain protein [Candidatus Nitrosotenuis uzonensis]